MEEHPKSLKQSNQSLDSPAPNNFQPNDPQKQTCRISEHLLDQNQMTEIGRKARSALLESGRFKWDDQFRQEIDVQILETNFQSVRVMLHYGNYRLGFSAIYTDVDQKIFQEGDSKKGGFGVVRFLNFKRAKYAVKGIKFSKKDEEIDTLAAYKEYFLGCVADVLAIGPKIFPLFGYDILLTKAMIFFCMEECQQIKIQSPQLVQSQLLSNLKVMHSIRFVHNDIKPGNMGYSHQLQKHIFLDFGLSKFILQPPGEKTRTRFLGTLCYCSDEMRKCYLLQSSKYVDLYGNDFCCLNKVLKKFHSSSKIHTFIKGKDIMKKDTCQLTTFSEVIQLLRLKYYIQSQDTKKVQQILSTNKKTKKIIHQIFSSSLVPSTISNNESIKQKLILIRNELFSGKFQISELDYMLCEIFSQEKSTMTVEKIIPISQILHSKPELFNQYLVKPNLLLKLLHFFDQFTKSQKRIENKYEIKRAMIEKIYQMKNTESIEPVFFYEKARFALAYFYEKLKGLKNLKCMLTLRLLFVLMQQWKFVQSLSNQIIQMIEEPFLKVLKIVQFTLFKLSCQRSSDMIQQQPAIDARSTKLDLSQPKAKRLLQIIEPSRLKNISRDSDEKRRQALNVIYGISEECANFYQKESISNIYYTYISICQSYSFSPTLLQKFPKKQAQDIFYSIGWFFTSVQLESGINQQQKIFWPLNIEYFSYSRKQQSKNLLEVLVQNELTILENRVLSLGHFIEYTRLFRPDRKIVYFWLGKFLKIFKSQSLVPKEQIVFSLYCLSEFLQLVLRNQLQAKEDNRIGIQQKASMINGLEQAFSRFIAKQQIKQATENFTIKAKVGIARIKFDFEKGKALEELRPQIQTLVNMLWPLSDLAFRLSYGFLTVFNYLSKFIRSPESSYLKDILIKIIEQYIDRKKFGIFEGLSQMPEYYVRINNEKGRENRNLEVILQLIEYYKNERIKIQISNSLPIQTFYILVDTFCTTLPIQKLLTIYLQLRFSKKQYLCGYYAYLIFSIFLRIRMQINEPDQLRQVIKTTLCLANIPPMCFIKSKLEIVRLYRPLVTFKSRRKAFICRRLEVRNTISSNRIKAFMGELRNKVDKIAATRKRTEVVLLKLEEKIQKIKKG